MSRGVRRSERTVYVVTSNPEGVEVRNMVAAWTQAGIVDDSLWVTPGDITVQPSGPPVVTAAYVQRGAEESRVDLFTALATHSLSSVRLVVLQLLTHPGSGDLDVVAAGKTLREAVRIALPRRPSGDSASVTTHLRAVNALIPVSRAYGATRDLLLPGWDANVVVSPEDRPDLDRATVFVRHPGNFVGHAAVAASALGGILDGMDQGALDHLELDSTTTDHDLLVARFTVRSVVGDDIVEALATQTFSMDSFGPDGPASVLPDARVAADPLAVAEQAANHVLDSPLWADEPEPVAPQVTAYSRGLWPAIRHAAKFNLQMFPVMARWVKSRMRMTVEKGATSVLVGEGAGISVRIGAGAADVIVEAAERELAQAGAKYREMSAASGQQLIHLNPAAWTLMREMATALIDGSQLPEAFPEPRVSGKRELLPAWAVVPLPGASFTSGDDLQIEPLDVRKARRYRNELDEKFKIASERCAELEKDLDEREAAVIADESALSAFLEQNSDSLDADDSDADEAGDAAATEGSAARGRSKIAKLQRERRRLEMNIARSKRRRDAARQKCDTARVDLAVVEAAIASFDEWDRHQSSYIRELVTQRVERLMSIEDELATQEEHQPEAPPRERLVARQKAVHVVWAIAWLAVAAGILASALAASTTPITPEFIATAVTLTFGPALMAVILANHAFYRAVQRYEWELAQLMARLRGEFERDAWRRRQAARLSVQERALMDWGAILAEVFHKPWGVPERMSRHLADDIVEQLPASMGVAGLASATEMPYQSLAAAARVTYAKGWLSRVFEQIAGDFDQGEVETDSGFSAVDADTSDRPTGPRRRFKEFVADMASRESATANAVRRFRSAVAEGEIPIPTRTVLRRGPFSDGIDVDEPVYFSAVAAESIEFASDGFTAIGLQGRDHYVARSAVWLPASAKAKEKDAEMYVFTASGANAVRVDLSRRVTPVDLYLFSDGDQQPTSTSTEALAEAIDLSDHGWV